MKFTENALIYDIFRRYHENALRGVALEWYVRLGTYYHEMLRFRQPVSAVQWKRLLPFYVYWKVRLNLAEMESTDFYPMELLIQNALYFFSKEYGLCPEVETAENDDFVYPLPDITLREDNPNPPYYDSPYGHNPEDKGKKGKRIPSSEETSYFNILKGKITKDNNHSGPKDEALQESWRSFSATLSRYNFYSKVRDDFGFMDRKEFDAKYPGMTYLEDISKTFDANGGDYGKTLDILMPKFHLLPEDCKDGDVLFSLEPWDGEYPKKADVPDVKEAEAVKEEPKAVSERAPEVKAKPVKETGKDEVPEEVAPEAKAEAKEAKPVKKAKASKEAVPEVPKEEPETVPEKAEAPKAEEPVKEAEAAPSEPETSEAKEPESVSESEKPAGAVSLSESVKGSAEEEKTSEEPENKANGAPPAPTPEPEVRDEEPKGVGVQPVGEEAEKVETPKEKVPEVQPKPKEISTSQPVVGEPKEEPEVSAKSEVKTKPEPKKRGRPRKDNTVKYSNRDFNVSSFVADLRDLADALESGEITLDENLFSTGGIATVWQPKFGHEAIGEIREVYRAVPRRVSSEVALVYYYHAWKFEQKMIEKYLKKKQ